MPGSVEIGLFLALLCAFTSILGFLYKYRGAAESPPITLNHPVSSTVALFRSRWWLLGIAVAMVSWGFHVAALSLAPISIVQTVIAGGLVLLGVVADRLFGFTVSRREWIGVGLTAAGLAFLAATLDGGADSAHNDWTTPTLAAYVGGLSVLGLAAAGAARVAGTRGATVLAASAGLIWGASDVSIKALSKHTGEGLAVLGHPLALVILVASLVGLAVSARSLQIGAAVPVIAVTSAAANVATIASGPIVFGEPLPDDAGALMLRIAAFALVILAASLTPPPLVEEDPEPQPV